MSNRTLSYLLVVVIILMLIVFAQNFLNLTFDTGSEKYVSLSEVESMAVVSGGKEYNLNFSQSLKIVDILNHSVKVDFGAYLKSADDVFEWEKLIIYQREKPAVEITPFAFVDRQLLFSAPAWNKTGLMREMGTGQLNSILSETYDK